jgi:heptosyltransferase-2
MNVGIFLPNWIGDVAMATPSLRALRQSLGNRVRLVGVMRPYVAEVLRGTNWLDREIHFDRRAPDTKLHSRSLVRQLRDERLDTILLMTNSLRSAWLAWRSGTPQRIGYVRYGRGPLLTEKLYAPRLGWKWQPLSAVDYYGRIAETLGVNLTSRTLELATTFQNEVQADQIWDALGIHRDEPVVALNTGGAYGAAKDWPAASFAELARHLAERHGRTVVIICGPAERANAERIAGQANHSRVFSLAAFESSIGLSKAIIRRCQLLVSTDSGPRHFGAAFGVPTVSLFGPTDPRWSYNYHPQGTELQKPVPCGPCAKRQCPLQHHRCMQELSVREVLQAACQLMRQSEQQRVA